MSLIERMIEMVQERGSGTADELWPLIAAEGYTRDQVLKALQNAKTTRRLDSDGHVPCRGVGARGSVCTRYRPPSEDFYLSAGSGRSAGLKYASVFHYAQGVPLEVR